MGFFGLLFGDRIQNENKTKRILDCSTLEERKDWFARTRPWHKVPDWLVHEVVTQLSGRQPTTLQLFIDTAMKARLVPQLEELHRVEPSTVALAVICGIFLRVGGPLAQEVLRTKRHSSSSDEEAAHARDCLVVALRLSDTPLAYPLLATLLAHMGQFEEALECAEEGLSAVQGERDQSDLGDADDEFGEAEDLARVERQLQETVDAMTSVIGMARGKTGADHDDEDEKNEGRRSSSLASHTSRVLVEYSKDEGERGPGWMQNNVDPILGLYFTPQPNDPAWSPITGENVAAYQLWFQRALLRAKLHEAHSSESLVGERAEAVCNTAFQAKEEHGLNPILVLVLSHQYVEADLMVRGLHTVDWVTFMMSRNNCAPSPEGIAKFVIDFYGLQRAP
jgi:hypothetical protein